jgi:hypothetical protein
MKKQLLYCILLVNMCACEQIIELDMPKEDPKMVLNCVFTVDEYFVVQLTKSQYILDQAKTQNVVGANVELFDGNTFLEKLELEADGTYITKNTKAVLGKNYTIKASHHAFDPISSEAYLPNPVEITKWDTTRVMSDGMESIELRITFKDPAHERNYYNISLMATYYDYTYDNDTWQIIDSVLVEEPIYYSSRDPLLSDGSFGIPKTNFSDEFFNGKTQVVSVLIDPFYLDNDPYTGDFYKRISLKFNSISWDYYLYFTSLEKHRMTKQDPFAQPVQVYNNIKNGYGIFCGYTPTTVHIKNNL